MVLKRNIPRFVCFFLQYVSIAAFFNFQNEKIFSFQVEDFRQTAFFSGGLPDRSILAYAERRATKPIMTLFSRKNRCTPIALSKQKRMKKRPAAAERGNIPHLSVAPQDLAPYGVIATGCRTSSGLFPPSLLIRLFTCPPDTIARLSGFVNR